jgi:ribonuclease-3
LNESIERLQRALGYRFQDGALLVQALTHRSCGQPHNERLEFLGDGLLNFVIGEVVYRQRARSAEGELSRLRVQLVREETLAEVARRLVIGDALRLGTGELRSGGFRRDSILADTLEAVLGAIYLDGGFDAARGACERIFAPELAALPDSEALKDAKTRLQEALQAQSRPLPEYALVEESGPAHQRRFLVSCRLPDSKEQTEGEAGGRKLAEQQAAEKMLERLSVLSSNRNDKTL